MACGIWESLNHRKVGICVEGQTAASAHERGKGALTHRCPEWWRGNWFAFRSTRTTATQPFFHRLPPTGKLKKNRRSPQETQFIFLSTSSHFSFLLSIHIKKKSPKRHQTQTKIFLAKSRHQLLQTTILLVCHTVPPPCTPDLASIHPELNLYRTGKV